MSISSDMKLASFYYKNCNKFGHHPRNCRVKVDGPIGLKVRASENTPMPVMEGMDNGLGHTFRKFARRKVVFDQDARERASACTEVIKDPDINNDDNLEEFMNSLAAQIGHEYSSQAALSEPVSEAGEDTDDDEEEEDLVSDDGKDWIGGNKKSKRRRSGLGGPLNISKIYDVVPFPDQDHNLTTEEPRDIIVESGEEDQVNGDDDADSDGSDVLTGDEQDDGNTAAGNDGVFGEGNDEWGQGFGHGEPSADDGGWRQQEATTTGGWGSPSSHSFENHTSQDKSQTADTTGSQDNTAELDQPLQIITTGRPDQSSAQVSDSHEDHEGTDQDTENHTSEKNSQTIDTAGSQGNTAEWSQPSQTSTTDGLDQISAQDLDSDEDNEDADHTTVPTCLVV